MKDNTLLPENRQPSDEIKRDYTTNAPDTLSSKLLAKVKDMQLGDMIVEDWSSMINDKTEWMNRLTTYLANWDEFLEIAPQGMFSTSSNLHVPMTFWVAKAYHARFMQAMYNPDLQVSISARKKQHIEAALNMKDIIMYTCSEWANKNKGVEDTIDNFLWQWISQGVGILKTRWDCEYEKFVELETKIIFDDNNMEYMLNSDGSESIIPRFTTEEIEVEKVEKIFEGPISDLVLLEDICVSNNNYEDINSADKVIHRIWYNASDLYTKADQGIFDKEAVDEIIKAGGESVSGAIGAEFKLAKAQSAANSTLDKTYELDKFEVLEAYYRIPIDNSGINSNIVVWVHPKTRKVLRAAYLRMINRKSGKRPFASAVFHKKSGTNENFPVGLPEILHSLQKELDAIHNMRMDFGLIGSIPFGFYKTGSSLSPKEMRIEPGTFYEVDNPSDIYIPNVGNRTGFLMQEEINIYNMVERITSISDVALGSMGGGTQGVTRTAFGTQTLQREMNTNLDTPLKRLNRGIKQWLEYLVHLVQQRIPAGFEYKIVGDDGLERYNKINNIDQIVGDFDFVLATNSSNSNKQIQLETATQLLQMTSNPLDIQIGVVTPANRFEAIKNYLRTIGVRDVNKYLNGEYENAITLTPAEEVQRVCAGLEVPVLPNSDHAGVIEFINMLITDENAAEKLTQPQMMLLRAHSNKHQQMMEALKEMQAKQQVYNQMINNQSAGQAASQDNNIGSAAAPTQGME